MLAAETRDEVGCLGQGRAVENGRIVLQRNALLWEVVTNLR
jgi:hypothetical protein